MARWLLNTFPTWLLALIFSGGFAALALAGELVVRRWAPHLTTGEHNEVASLALALVIGLYGVVLGFVIVTLYDDHKAANSTAQTEAANLEDLYRLSLSFDPTARSEVANAVGNYARTVVHEEYPLLTRAEASSRAGRHLDAMFRVLRSYEPSTSGQTAFFEEALRALHSVHVARHVRLDASRESLPGVLQAFIILGAIVLIVFLYFVRAKSRRVHTIMVVALAAMLGFTVILVVILDHPFSGDIAVRSDHFSGGSLNVFFK